jgi:hypothetical protein
MRLGVADAFIEKPGVHIVIVLEPQARREEPLPRQADLIFDLALLPAGGRRAGDRLDEMMAAHLREATIELAFLADEDRLHRRLHIVVDSARAGAPEEGKGAPQPNLCRLRKLACCASNTISCVSRG